MPRGEPYESGKCHSPPVKLLYRHCRGGYQPPGSGAIMHQGQLNGKTYHNRQKLPLGEAAEHGEAEEGSSVQLFHAHPAANPYNVPPRPTFFSLFQHPTALFCPGKPEHLPPREAFAGGLGLIPFNQGHTDQRCASGRLIASPTGCVKFLGFRRRSEPGGPGQKPDT